jgi:hypothetical protein
MLLRTLKDMHLNEEAFMYRNRSDDMTCMLRSTSEKTDQLMSFDLVIVYDESKDVHGAFKHVLDMEYTLVEDEGGDFIFDTITVANDATPDDMDEAVESINMFYELSICECYKNLVKSPTLGLCYMCAIGRDPEYPGEDSCVICADTVHTARGSVCMKCCNQPMHKKCYERWRSEEETRSCPICRK